MTLWMTSVAKVFGYPDDQYSIFPEVSLEFCTIGTTGHDMPKEKNEHLTSEQRY